MERAGLHAAAADRRRHHEQGAHRGEDRAGLQRARGPRARRLARGGRRRASSRAREQRDGVRRRRTARSRSGCAESTSAKRAAEQPLLTLEEARRAPHAARLDGLRAAAARRSPGRARPRRRARSPRSCRSSTGRRSSTPGSCAAPTRASSRTPTGGRGRRSCSTTRRRLLKTDRGGRQPDGAGASYGFFPANAVGDDIEVYADERARGVLGHAAHAAPAGRRSATASRPRRSPTSWRPARRGLADYIGAFAVTAGLGIDALVAALERDHDDYRSIMAKALADRLAEALAEWLHQRARAEWGYGRGRGARRRRADPRALPRHPARARLSGLPRPHREAAALRPAGRRERVGIQLTESFAMLPAASVSGFYFSHPEARYFAVGGSGATRCSTTSGARAWTCATRRALARAEPRLRPRRGPGREGQLR